MAAAVPFAATVPPRWQSAAGDAVDGEGACRFPVCSPQIAVMDTVVVGCRGLPPSPRVDHPSCHCCFTVDTLPPEIRRTHPPVPSA